MTSKDKLQFSTLHCKLLGLSKLSLAKIFIYSLGITTLIPILYSSPSTSQINSNALQLTEMSSRLLAQPNREDVLFFETKSYAVRVYIQAGKHYINAYDKASKVVYNSQAEISHSELSGKRWKIYISENKKYEARFSEHDEAELQVVIDNETKITELAENKVQSNITFANPFVDWLSEPLNRFFLGGFLVVVFWPFVRDRAGDFLENTCTFISGKKFEHRYLEFLIKNYYRLPDLPSTLVDVKQGKIRELDKLYVSLSIGEENEEISIEEALNKNSSLAILGDPGAGKTTMLRFLTLTFAKARRGVPSPAKIKEMRQKNIPIDISSFREARRNVKNSFKFKKYPLPIFFSLSRFQNITEWEPDRGLLDALRDELKSSGVLADFPENFFSNKLKRGECIFLFDAFDELAQTNARDKVAQLIGLLASSSSIGNRFVVTSRKVGYSGQLDESGFHTLTVQRLSWNLISNLVEKWYASLDAPELVEPLLNTLKEKEQIYELAVNPMLLSLIALVQFVLKIIPAQRHILYDECVKILVDRRYAARQVREQYNQTLPAYEAIRLLRKLAIRMLWIKILERFLFKRSLGDFEKKIQMNFNAVVFKKKIGSICSKYPNILVSILRRNNLDNWTQIALDSTQIATPDVLKEVLQLIRDPELKSSLKKEIFKWLCRVNVDSAGNLI